MNQQSPPSPIILFNKPYGVICQFRGELHEKTLTDFIPWKGFYPAGRLDKASEGLLLLTNDGRLQDTLSHPRHGKRKRYWVQVEGIPDDDRLEPLRRGLVFRQHQYLPAHIRCINAPNLWERIPPIRERKTIPTSWVDVTIAEGKNHQLRHMLAAVGFPVLRLVRYEAAGFQLGDLAPGEFCFAPGNIRISRHR